MAPEGGGLNLLSPRRISPNLNKDDGFWNHGEAARGSTADQGGTRPDPSYFTGSFTLANLVTTSPWANRTYTGNFQVRTWIGRLQRAQPVSGD